MTNKILVQLPIGAHSPNLEITLSYTNELIKQGNDITILTCSGSDDSCLYNPLGLPSTCRSCKRRTREALSHLIGGYKHEETLGLRSYKFNYHSTEELKAIKYKSTNVGYSALSSYASLTRSVDIDYSNKKTRLIIDKYLSTACKLTDSVVQLQQHFSFDKFVLFNSRLNTYRSFFDLAKIKNIPVTVVELNFSKENAMIFENAMPHDIAYNGYLVESLFKNLGYAKTEQRAIEFFNNRAKSLFSNEESYTKQQNKDLLPDNWDPKKKKIAIFNSSEDEFMAIGGSWEENRLFKNQYEGLTFISNYAKDHNIIFYLRIHPNLRGTQKSYLEKLLALKSDNFVVIPPESKISTYNLMYNCDAIITFGSSIGVEATYWSKPSILLGNCFYRHLNITYNPTSTKELITLIESDLEPIDNKLGCLKMASHMINPGFKVHGYSFNNKKGYINGKEIKRKKSLLQKIESKYTKHYLKSIKS
ncbi:MULTISPECIES: hypothetical protein [unclassified Vibrio]|uniref:capsular polysaccharide export protein, LipB/KpsS family n=1 Tax=unclassified Vibrio TaxID=2614977 RepID=UPI00296532AB|nr:MULTISPECIES: hypothetical protein [unclassified Vibrio]MDW2022498.1 hypothetical protein [Vibrio sp. 397]MDW2027521.1 hypothetical protein [Vibrio sp. 399]MDW2213699.1 hypothetical protein [Vibrio sp. 1982]